MNKILYYPYINIPRVDWISRNLLYYDEIGSIVPREFLKNPNDNFEPFMLNLIQNKLVIPIDSKETLDGELDDFNEDFFSYIEANKHYFESKRNVNIDFHKARVHNGKFEDILFNKLERIGLAKRGDNSWYWLEERTADFLMKLLSSYMGAKLGMQPTTDEIDYIHTQEEKISQQCKREVILDQLIPYPEDINLFKLQKFKEKHRDLLLSFKEEMEIIVMDSNIKEDTNSFRDKVQELKYKKNELSRKMSENNFRKIIEGAVYGLCWGLSGVMANDGKAAITNAAIGSLLGAKDPIKNYRRTKKLVDQSNLKYLALLDNQLRPNLDKLL